MSDYPIADGVFLKALDKMPEENKLPFISIEGERLISNYVGMNAHTRHSKEGTAAADGMPLEDAPPKPKKNKVKYSCPSCGVNVWDD